MKSQVNCTEFNKSQFIRLADMLVLAPLLIYAGTRKSLSPTLRYALIGVGALTFAYNGYYYFRNAMNEGKISKTLNDIEEKVQSEFDNEK